MTSIVAFIRRHDEYIESRFAENLKQGIASDWNDYQKSQAERESLFVQNIKVLTERRYFDQLILRPFEPKDWQQNRRADDFFFHVFSMAAPENLKLPVRQNETPDPRVLNILVRLFSFREFKSVISPAICKRIIIPALQTALVKAGTTDS